MAFNNEIEELKGQIKVLEKKLSFLEELEKTKTPCEEAYKNVYGFYPKGRANGVWTISDEDYWNGFQAGYNAAYKEPEENEWKLVALKLGEKLSDNGPGGYYDFTPGEWFEWALNECEREMIKRNLKTSLREMVNGDVRPIDDVVKEAKKQQIKEAKEQQIKDAVRESVRWCEENPDKNPLDCLKPQTPKETEQSLKEAFVKAQQTEKWKEIQKKIDTPAEGIYDNIDIDKLLEKWEKDPPEFLRFELGQSLYDLIEDWWSDIFTTGSDWDSETSIGELVERIKQWLPKEQSAAGSQSLGVEDMVEGFNDALKKIKSKLR